MEKIWNTKEVEKVKDSLMTSADWCEYTRKTFLIIDPDGWDRFNYRFSFYEEKISMEEFEKRVSRSTISLTGGMVSFKQQLFGK